MSLRVRNWSWLAIVPLLLFGAINVASSPPETRFANGGATAHAQVLRGQVAVGDGLYPLLYAQPGDSRQVINQGTSRSGLICNENRRDGCSPANNEWLTMVCTLTKRDAHGDPLSYFGVRVPERAVVQLSALAKAPTTKDGTPFAFVVDSTISPSNYLREQLPACSKVT